MTSPARRPSWLLTVLVLVIGLATTGTATATADQSLERDRARRFDAAAERARGAVAERLELYSANLSQVRTWMMVDGAVTRDEFESFVALGFDAGLYPGARALSFAVMVERSEVGAFEAAVRAEVAGDESHPPFEVHPDSAEPDAYVVTYLTPLEGNEPAFGFDLGADPARRRAVESARDRGDPVGTGPIRLIQETGDQAGFVLVSPVYDTVEIPPTAPARRRHFIGVITVVFRLDDMLAGVLGPLRETEAEVYDLGATVDPPRLRFDETTRLIDTSPATNVSADGNAAGLQRHLDLNIGDRRWRMILTPGPGFLARSRALPLAVAGLGTLVSLLLAAAVHRAVRDRGRAEQRATEMTADLRVAEARSASILLGAPDAMLVVGGSGLIESVNLAAESLFGYAAGEMEGQPVEMLLPANLGAAHRAHRAAYLAAPRRREMGAEIELLATRRDGSSFPVEVSLSPLTDSSGGLEVIAAVRDVSERRIVQAALQSAYDHERETAEQLREADELKTRFLNTISHELRTPLTAISGFTDLLLTSDLSPEQRDDYLNRIRRNSHSLAGLIGDVLSFAHLDDRSQGLSPVATDLSTEIRLIADQLAPIVDGQHVVVDAPEPVPVYVDRGALIRIVTNLLTNVARYAPEGTTATLTATRRGSRAVLTVADEGPGIPPEERERVFDRFFRGRTALDSRKPGTGIGLAVVSELATRSGGSVRVVPHEGIGARFEIELPGAARS